MPQKSGLTRFTTRVPIVLFLSLSACGSFKTTRIADIDARTGVAKNFAKYGHGDAAEKTLRGLRQDHRDRQELSLTMGKVYFEKGDHLSALGAYNKANDFQESAEGWIGIGKVHLARNNADAALNAFQKAVKLAPHHPDAHNGIAVSKDLSGDHLEAQEIYDQLLVHYAGRKDIWNNYGLSLAFSGDYEKSKSIFKELLLSDWSTRKVRQNLAFVMMLESDWAGARRLARMDIKNSDVEKNIKFVRHTR